MRKNSYPGFLLIFFSLFFATPALANPPEILGTAAVALDGATGQILYEKELHKRMYPASTTKTLTAIIALESSNLNDYVLIPSEACGLEGSAIGLHEGELLTMEDLLYAMLLNSGNDAAVAIAVHVGGSVSGFVELMNRKAAALQAFDSHFNNPNGLPDVNHYSSAYDLALIAGYAMQNRDFRKIVATGIKEIQRTYPDAQTSLANSNRLLFRYPGALGVKTGYTDAAGQCLIAAAARQGRELITVVLNSEGQNVYADSIALLEYGFNEFKLAPVLQNEEYITDLPVKNGTLSSVSLVAGRPVDYYLPAAGGVEISREILAKEEVTAPIKAGDKLGELVLSADGREFARVNLLSGADVGKQWFVYWRQLGYVLAFFLLFALVRRQRRESRRRAYLRRRRRQYYLDQGL